MPATKINLEVITRRESNRLETASAAVVEDPDPNTYKKAVEVASELNKLILIAHQYRSQGYQLSDQYLRRLLGK